MKSTTVIMIVAIVICALLGLAWRKRATLQIIFANPLATKLLWIAFGVLLAASGLYIITSIGSPSLESVWEATKNYWLWILIGLLLLMFGTMFVPDKPAGVRSGSQMLIVAIAILFFAVAPLGTWIHEYTLPTVTCPDTTRKTQSCLLNTRWTNWIKPGGGIADNGLTPCYSNSEEIVAEFADFAGTTHYRFRAKTGQVAMSYAALDISATKQCPLTLPS